MHCQFIIRDNQIICPVCNTPMTVSRVRNHVAVKVTHFNADCAWTERVFSVQPRTGYAETPA